MASEIVDLFVQAMRTHMDQSLQATPDTHAVLLRRLLPVVDAILVYEPYTIVPVKVTWADAVALEARWRNGRSLTVATRCDDASPDSRLTLFKYNEVSMSVSVSHEQLLPSVDLCLRKATSQATDFFS
ncbi:hypothetical protein [Hymenobacter koreensis]|uniref:Uncharacterized protein n=1 Tax=Hymenobacter koreensis TaxID=1084523 RepID=A0ABP8IV61_9BACT